jgi:hypothetical protein
MNTSPGLAPLISRFLEADYCYGIGPLAIKIQRIDWATPVPYDGDTWYEIDGIEVSFDGREIGPRRALVRGRCLASRPKTPNA